LSLSPALATSFRVGRSELVPGVTGRSASTTLAGGDRSGKVFARGRGTPPGAIGGVVDLRPARRYFLCDVVALGVESAPSSGTGERAGRFSSADVLLSCRPDSLVDGRPLVTGSSVELPTAKRPFSKSCARPCVRLLADLPRYVQWLAKANNGFQWKLQACPWCSPAAVWSFRIEREKSEIHHHPICPLVVGPALVGLAFWSTSEVGRF